MRANESIPIQYGLNNFQKPTSTNEEYKALRREHSIAAMCDVIAGNVTGQGKDALLEVAS